MKVIHHEKVVAPPCGITAT